MGPACHLPEKHVIRCGYRKILGCFREASHNNDSLQALNKCIPSSHLKFGRRVSLGALQHCSKSIRMAGTSILGHLLLIVIPSARA